MRLNINLIETSPVHKLCRGSSESHGNKRHYHCHLLIHKHWEISQHWCDTVLILSVSLESSPLFKEPLATIRNCNLAFKDIVCTPPPPIPPTHWSRSSLLCTDKEVTSHSKNPYLQHWYMCVCLSVCMYVSKKI